MNRLFQFVVSALILFPEFAYATKPCPGSPCFDSSSKFISQECREVATWIGIGNIENVQSHVEGYPLNKDFADYEIVFHSMEKGPTLSRLKMRVQWCSPELPKDRTGTYRFYGSGNGEKLEILAIERVQEK